jgi:hypothetical protein
VTENPARRPRSDILLLSKDRHVLSMSKRLIAHGVRAQGNRT